MEFEFAPLVRFRTLAQRQILRVALVRLARTTRSFSTRILTRMRVPTCQPNLNPNAMPNHWQSQSQRNVIWHHTGIQTGHRESACLGLSGVLDSACAL